MKVTLPRANLLLLGGDLAYPNPSKDTYEQRLFVPFQVGIRRDEGGRRVCEHHYDHIL